MHGIDLTTQMDIFYHAMNYTSKGIIDASYSGGFKRRSVEEARQVIEDLAKCNYKTPSESSGSSSGMRGNGLIGLDRITTIEANLDAVMNKLSRNEKMMHTAHEVGVVREGRRNSAEGYEEEEPYQVEEAQYLNENKSYTFKPNSNLPTYNSLALRTHEIFSYGGKHNRALDMDRNTIRFILSLGSNGSSNNSSSSKIGTVEEIIKGRKELKPLKIRCCNS